MLNFQIFIRTYWKKEASSKNPSCAERVFNVPPAIGALTPDCEDDDDDDDANVDAGDAIGKVGALTPDCEDDHGHDAGGADAGDFTGGADYDNDVADAGDDHDDADVEFSAPDLLMVRMMVLVLISHPSTFLYSAK